MTSRPDHLRRFIGALIFAAFEMAETLSSGCRGDAPSPPPLTALSCTSVETYHLHPRSARV